MRRLIPREARFFDQFEHQSRCIIDAAARLHDLVHDFADLRAKVAAIKDVEHEGDRVTHEIATRLNTTFVTPLDREDIHDLASRLDDVLDHIDAAASALLVYRIAAPTSACRAMADVIIDTVAAMDRTVHCLRTFDRAFREHAIEIHRHENRADELLRSSVAGLFAEGVNPIDVLKWKDIYEMMEGATDRCEDVANVIEAIMLKMS
jgi:hypothetical protein